MTATAEPCMNNISDSDVCCLLTAGNHPRVAIEKLISFTVASPAHISIFT